MHQLSEDRCRAIWRGVALRRLARRWRVERPGKLPLSEVCVASTSCASAMTFSSSRVLVVGAGTEEVGERLEEGGTADRDADRVAVELLHPGEPCGDDLLAKGACLPPAAAADRARCQARRDDPL